MRSVRTLAAAMLSLLAALSPAHAAEKQGGILRIYHRDSPGSASIHEGATYSVNVPFMPVFNNLVRLRSERSRRTAWTRSSRTSPTSWAWSSDNKTLTFKLHQGVNWHDGKPFTSADVKCTFDMLMGKSPQKFRQNPRKSWYDQVNDVTTNGDYEVSFHLKRPQPALLALLASGYTPVYPCHVSPARDAHPPDRHRPVQIRRVQAQRIDQAGAQPGLLEEGPAVSRRHRVHHHSRTARPRSSAFVAGQFDMTFPTEVSIPLLEGRQVAGAERGLRGRAEQRLHQHHRQFASPPFDNLDIRRALALALDRKAFIAIMFEGQGDIGGTMLPAAGGPVGHAEGNAGDDPGLWPRRRTPTATRRAS